MQRMHISIISEYTIRLHIASGKYVVNKNTVENILTGTSVKEFIGQLTLSDGVYGRVYASEGTYTYLDDVKIEKFVARPELTDKSVNMTDYKGGESNRAKNSMLRPECY